MTFTAAQVFNYLNEEPDEDDFQDTEAYDLAYEKWEETIDEFYYEGGTVGDFGNFKPVASWSYGDGKEQGVVFQHEESGRFFKALGYYSSWDSSTWDSFDEVEPYSVVKTRYRKVYNGSTESV